MTSISWRAIGGIWEVSPSGHKGPSKSDLKTEFMIAKQFTFGRQAWAWCLLLLGGTANIQAQPEEAIRTFGQEVFRYLSDTAAASSVEYIRIKTWKNLFEVQDWSYRKTAEAKLNVDQHYEQQYRRFYRITAGLQQQLRQEKARGVKVAPLHFSYRRSRDTIGILHGTWQVLIKEEAMQTVERWRFPFHFNGRGFMLTGPVRVGD